MDQQQKQQKEYQKKLKEMGKRLTARNERVNGAEYKEREDNCSFPGSLRRDDDTK